ncbi:MAG: lipid-A-disaccharide synthase [Planctomycetota bacterium]
MAKSLYFSVGEPSGDQHAARMIGQLRAQCPGIRTLGMGGPSMAAAGCELMVDLTQHAVVGLVEVLPKLREFFRFADQAEAVFRKGGIDAVVLVDFPGFNWHIAKRAKKYKIPVFYYCPPQLWAWAPWRIGKLRRHVDHVLSVLPFEHEYFQRRGIDSVHVGHPFFDAVEESPLHKPTVSTMQESMDGGKRLVAVLPGSRTAEVHGNFPLQLSAIERLAQRHPDCQFMVAAHRDSHALWCRRHWQENESRRQLPIEIFVGRTSEIIEMACCAMMVSGSVSLELMARKTPAAVTYRVGRIMHALGKRLIRVDSLSLPNLMHDQHIFPEHVSVGDSKPAVDFLVKSMDAYLSDEFYRRGVVQALEELCFRYGRTGASERAAAEILKQLGVQTARRLAA